MEFYQNSDARSRHPLHTLFVILAIVIIIIVAWWLYTRLPNNKTTTQVPSAEILQYQTAVKALPEHQQLTDADIKAAQAAMNAIPADKKPANDEAASAEYAQQMNALPPHASASAGTTTQ